MSPWDFSPSHFCSGALLATHLEVVGVLADLEANSQEFVESADGRMVGGEGDHFLTKLKNPGLKESRRNLQEHSSVDTCEL